MERKPLLEVAPQPSTSIGIKKEPMKKEYIGNLKSMMPDHVPQVFVENNEFFRILFIGEKMSRLNFLLLLNRPSNFATVYAMFNQSGVKADFVDASNGIFKKSNNLTITGMIVLEESIGN
jgi:hypothetical protein